MTKQRYQDVADLIEAAFQTISGVEAAPDIGRATLQIGAANAIATLALAAEVRAVGLLLAAHGGVTPAAELARDAFTAAAIHLDLVEPEPERTAEDLMESMDTYDPGALYADGADPADADGDLK